MIRDQLLAAVYDALGDLGVDPPPSAIVVERPARREHGDWSTNAALVCAKAAGRNPRQLGQELAAALEAKQLPHVESLEIAGPGFVNFRLASSWLTEVLAETVTAGEAGFARLDLGRGARINVEFVSANPTGPLHAGHGRWAAFGDSLCRIFERCGFVAHRETYVNDRGVQIELFGQSLAARKRGEEPPPGGYEGDYVTEWAAEMPDDADPARWGLERALADHRDALGSMHVYFDTWASERASVDGGYLERALAQLREGGYVYEADGATWLRTTEYGDDKDRVLIKADGSYTYLLPDIGYHQSKYERGDHLIDVLGADHHGYVARMRAALQMLGHPADSYEAIIGQNVKLMRDGAEVKLSKRKGDMIELRADLVDDLGPDVARFAYLLQSIDTALTIDIDLLRQQAAENPVYYVQYAYARISSIGRKAAELGIERPPLSGVDLSVLTHERELEVLRQLSVGPEVVELACVDRAPHKVANWLRDLAGAYHGFQHDCPILHPDTEPEVRDARLWLVEGARVGLAVGLDLLGTSAPTEM